ncbi:hypothetical protein Tco_1492189 [Tanacetum coccineum]
MEIVLPFVSNHFLTSLAQNNFKTEAKEEVERETETASVENDEKKNTQVAFVELSQGEVNTLGLDMS